MINFSGINCHSAIGRILRKFLALMPATAVVPILQGPLRGMKWVVGSSINGCWLGSYELEKQRCLADLVKPGMVVYDIGAHVGFYTLFFAKLVGPGGFVYAFEPATQNLDFLSRHIKLNHLTNVRVQETAVGDHTGQAGFILHPDSSSMNRLAALTEAAAEESVPLLALDDFIRNGNPRPDFIKMDIEGAEFLALQGMQSLLAEKPPILSIAIHGNEVFYQCQSLLHEMNYRVCDLNNQPLIPNKYYDEIISYSIKGS